MHELGIVFYIKKDVEKVALENNVKRVRSVAIEVGEVSGIIEDQLKDCWRWAADKSDVLRGAELDVEISMAETFCEDCENIYPTVQFGKTCPKCGSSATYLLHGTDVNLKNITVEDETVSEEAVNEEAGE